MPIQDRTEATPWWIGLCGDSVAGRNRLCRPHPRTIPMVPAGVTHRTPPRPRSGSEVERVDLNLEAGSIENAIQMPVSSANESILAHHDE
jgi:hypothetical protein